MSRTLLLIGGIFLLFEFVRGWKRGVARCIVSLLALVVAYYVGYFSGTFAASLLHGLFPYPDFLLAAVLGLIIGTLVYFVLWLLSVIILKNTGQQRSGMVRFFYGFGGALIGLIYGVLILWGLVSFFRAAGAYAENRHKITQNSPSDTLDRQLIHLKNALGGSSPALSSKMDFMPQEYYEIIARVGRLTSDQDAMVRFSQTPQVQALMQNPRMTVIVSDPDVNRAFVDRDYFKLLKSPRIIEAMDDPEFRKAITSFDFNAALDSALQSPGDKKTEKPEVKKTKPQKQKSKPPVS